MSRLDDLRSARAFMWESMEKSLPDRRAALMAQWRALDEQVAALESEEGAAGDPIDEIAARRAARGGATARLGQADRRAR